MPDSVRCTQDSSNAFTCEVLIEGDVATAAESTPAASAAPPASAQSPAVASLVGSYFKQADAPLVSSEALLACGSNAIGLGLAIAAGAVPLVGPLAVFKASLDEMKCLGEEQGKAIDAAAEKIAEDDCAEAGGEITSVVGNRVFCDVTGASK